MATRTSRRDHQPLEGGTPRQAFLKDRRRRAAIRRRRRRAVSVLTLVPGLVFALTLVGAPGAPAQKEGLDEIVFEVNTAEDLVPSAADGNPDEVALAACLADDDMYLELLGGPGSTTVGTTAGNVEDNANGQADGAVAKVVEEARKTDPQNVPESVDVPDAEVVEKCSLRMALMASAALSPSSRIGTKPGGNRLVGPVRIEIRELTLGETLTLGPTDESGSGNLAVDAPAPLPPIAGGSVTIDGCAGFPSSTSPCINLDLSLEAVLTTQSEDVPALIAAADETTIKGIAFQGTEHLEYNPAILSPPVVTPNGGKANFIPDSLTVQNSWFGLRVKGDGTAEQDEAPDIGIQLSGIGATVGGTGPGQRNVFTAEEIGVLIAGGQRNQVVGNWFGTDGTGKQKSKLETRGAPVRLTGLGANASEVAGAQGGEDVAYNSLATGNRIEANVIAGSGGYGIDVGGEPMSAGVVGDGEPVGVSQTEIVANRIGLTTAGQPGENEDGGIIVRNGSRATTIGAEGAGNVISHNGGPGVVVQESEKVEVHGTSVLTSGAVFEEGAGSPTTVRFNSGQQNTKQLIDLGGDGRIGNDSDGPSGGIQEPVITGTTSTSASGTAAAGSTVDVYLVPASSVKGNGRGDVESHLATATADGAGQWTAQFPGSTTGERMITATATGAKGTSELAVNSSVPVLVQAQPRRQDPPAPPPADVTAPQITQVLGQSVEDGAVLKVKKPPKQISGELADESGIAEVRVALEVVKLKKKGKGKKSKKAKSKKAKRRAKKGKKAKGKKGKGKGKSKNKCKYFHLGKDRFVKRSCQKPPFKPADIEPTESGAAWEMPLSKKARKRMKPGRYLLHVQTVDTAGNTETQSLPLKVKKKFKGKKGGKKGKKKGKRGKKNR